MIRLSKLTLYKVISITFSAAVILFQISFAALLEGIQATERGDFKTAVDNFLPLYQKRSTTAISYLYYFSQENSPRLKSIQALLPKDLTDTFNALPKLLADSGTDYAKASITYCNIINTRSFSKPASQNKNEHKSKNKIVGRGRGLNRSRQKDDRTFQNNNRNNNLINQSNTASDNYYKKHLTTLTTSHCPRAKFLLDKLFKTNQYFKHHPQLKKFIYNANEPNLSFYIFLSSLSINQFTYHDAESLVFLKKRNLITIVENLKNNLFSLQSSSDNKPKDDIDQFLDSINNDFSQIPEKAAQFAQVLNNLHVYWMAFEDGDLNSAEPLAEKLYQDYSEATLWFYKLLAKNDPKQHALTCSRLFLDSSKKLYDIDEAISYAHIAEQESVPEAIERLGILYLLEGKNQDFEKAYRYSSQAAQHKFPNSIHTLAQIYDQGLGKPINKILAREYFKQAADLGARDAQHDYALMCEKGEGGEVDYESARTYFEKAIQNGRISSMSNSAMLFYHGLGGDKDLFKAREYLKKTVETRNIPGAENAYGAMLFNGEGGEKNFAEAKKYFEKSIQKGEALGYYNFAACHLMNKDELTDQKTCLKYAALAAKKGCKHAYLLLGDMYVQGFGCEKNNEKALEMYQKASGLGIATALVRYDALKKSLEENSSKNIRLSKNKKIKLTFKAAKADLEETKPEIFHEKTSSSSESEKTIEPEKAKQKVINQEISLKSEIGHQDKEEKSEEESKQEEPEDQEEFVWEGSAEQSEFETQCKKDKSAKHTVELIPQQYENMQKTPEQLTIAPPIIKLKINKRTMNYIDAIFQLNGAKLHSFRVGQVCTALQQLGCTVRSVKGENTVEATFETEEGITHRFTFHKPHGRQDNKINPNDRPYAETFLRAIQKSPEHLELK